MFGRKTHELTGKYLENLRRPKYAYETKLVEAPAAAALVGGPVTEFLLPRVTKVIEFEEFKFIEERAENPSWDQRELRRRIIDLGHWEYYFKFSHGLTSELHATFNDETKNFHRFRSKLISETVADLLGDSLPESTMLDLGSHCGVMALDMAYRGARAVLGVEFRRKNIDQANFLRDYYRIYNASFAQGDVYRFETHETWDVVLCLGLLYHLVRPIEIIEFCFERCRKFAVVDTICHKEPLSVYHLVTGKNPEVAIEGTRSVELQPTYRAVIDTLRAVGFKEIVEVIGKSKRAVELYSDLSRRCFVAFK